MVNKAKVLGLASLIASAAVLFGCDSMSYPNYPRRPDYPCGGVLVQNPYPVVIYPSYSVVRPHPVILPPPRTVIYHIGPSSFNNPHTHFGASPYCGNLPRHFPTPSHMPQVRPPMNHQGPHGSRRH